MLKDTKRLSELDLDFSHLRDEDLSILQDLPSLECVKVGTIGKARILTNESLRTIAKCANLRTDRIGYAPSFDGMGLSELAANKSIQEVTIVSNAHLTGEDLLQLTGWFSFDRAAAISRKGTYPSGENRRTEKHVILKKSFMNDYILKTCSGWKTESAAAAAELVRRANKFPEFKFLTTACLIKAAEYQSPDDPSRSENLQRVVDMEGEALERYRSLAESSPQQPGD